jgi:hypothetical protein
MEMAETAEQCLKFQPAIARALGNSLGQMLAAVSGMGAGGSGGAGYGLFGLDLALYGPDVQLSGRGTARRGSAYGEPRAVGTGRTGAETPEEAARRPGPARLRLQRNVKFPLRYRDLVGEYFRVIAESADEEGDGP